MFATSLLIVAANILAFLVYGYDKQQARNGGWRVSEGTLVMLAVVGGVGAWTGCEVFRHKTHKRSFRTYLVGAVIAHIMLVFAALAFAPA
jgi:uncharacterized membrane protein YsdA (DUF1294 family)